jgi:hypothetical protein
MRPSSTCTIASAARVAFPGFVEFDARMADAALAVATAALADGGPVEAVGIANQRRRRSCGARRPASPWRPASDGKTCARGMCLVLAAEGTLAEPVGDEAAFLLDMADPDRTRDDLRFGTVDTWIAGSSPTGRCT